MGLQDYIIIVLLTISTLHFMSHEERPTQPVLMITGVVSLMSVYSPAPEARRSADL